MKSTQKLNMRLLWQEWRGASPAVRQNVETMQIAQKVADDQWTVIRIEGMHCHNCEAAIQKLLSQMPGVHEAEVDFNSGQASVLFNHTIVSAEQLLEAIREAGYQATPSVHA
jgi:copper chaperone